MRDRVPGKTDRRVYGASTQRPVRAVQPQTDDPRGQVSHGNEYFDHPATARKHIMIRLC